MSGVFISYRHDGGEALARSIYEKLTAFGYSVFYDVESIKSERFPERLYREIEQCEDFVLILPKGGLDRCISDEDDWVRLEIAHALKFKKHIIPIIMRGFEFPTELPADIAAVSSYNGVSFESMDFFDARIQRLCEFLEAKPKRQPAPKPSGDSFVKKLTKKSVAVFSPIWRRISRICRFLWRFSLVRFLIILSLAFLLFNYGLDIVRDRINTNVDQWITPKILYLNNSYMESVSISRDNTQVAVYNGGDHILLNQTIGNVDFTETVGVLQTDFVGKNLLLGYSLNNNYLLALSEGQMEVFDTHTDEKIKKGTFLDRDPGQYVSNLLHEGDFEGYAALWADKAEGELQKCSVYGEDFSLQASFDMKGYYFLGGAGNSRYLLFFNNHREIRIIDVKNRCVVEDTLQTLKSECCGKIDDPSSRLYRFDETGRYVMCNIWDDEGRCDVIIKDMETGDDIFSRTYVNLQHFAFSGDGTFIVYYDNMNEEGVYTRRLNRVNFLNPNMPEEVLLSHEELVDRLRCGTLQYESQAVHLFNNSNTVLFAINNRLYLIDLDSKRITACCNPILSSGECIMSYSIEETENQIIVSIVSDDELREYADWMDFMNSTELSALRFSFARSGDHIVVTEDSYEEEREVNSYLAVAICALALGIFVYAGYFEDRLSRKKEA